MRGATSMLGRCEGIMEVEKIGQGSHRMYASYPEDRKEKISICKTRVKWETKEKQDLKGVASEVSICKNF